MNKFVSPGKTKTVNASVLLPENAGLRFILNVCGSDGKFDTKLEKLLAKRWLKAREGYKAWYADQFAFKMGTVRDTSVASDIWVVHLLAKDKEGKVDEVALAKGVKELAAKAKYEHASVHVSTMTTAEAPALVDLLKTNCVDAGTHVFYYNEPETA